jgi:hypothetical protein
VALSHDCPVERLEPATEGCIAAGTCRCVVTDEAADPSFRAQTAYRERPWGGPPPGAAHHLAVNDQPHRLVPQLNAMVGPVGLALTERPGPRGHRPAGHPSRRPWCGRRNATATRAFLKEIRPRAARGGCEWSNPACCLSLRFITVTAGGTLSGARAGASEFDGQGLHCESTAFRHDLYTEGYAAVGAYPDYSYVFGETEASAYKLVDGQRVPAEKVLVRIARSYIYVNGDQADASRARVGPPPTSAAPPATSSLVSCPVGTPLRLP